MKELRKKFPGIHIVLCADFNFVTKPSHVSPQMSRTAKEILWEGFNQVLDELSLIDCFEFMNPSAVGHFTHFHIPYGLFPYNQGLVLDRCYVTKHTLPYVKNCFVDFKIHRERGDHHALVLDLFIPTLQSVRFPAVEKPAVAVPAVEKPAVRLKN